MWCHSCREEYEEVDAGTCKECYEEASETEEELKREIHDLKAKLSFLRLSSPVDLNLPVSSGDIYLRTADSCTPIPAHKAVLMSRSPVFKAMLESEMEESRSGSIKITDVSYAVLRAFVHFLYTAESLLDEQMACDLLVLAEKYQVKHLKTYCEKFMISKVNSETAVLSLAFAHRHNAKMLLETALGLILENMSTLTAREGYRELVDKEPRLVVEIYESYLSKVANTAREEQ
ncbi:BTB/POZ domain-containing protein [Wolffia australiana]